MADVALYRKYRPKTFAAVVGQEHVVQALKGALKEKGVGHAYLFFGSRGTGKTSVARIFASELGAGENDIHEIDAASYTGVDNIRALREEAAVLPFGSSKKVYIVDEVHMLSKSAFNAFLKLLEEPPEHVVFILATTELEKVPDTIQSRCQVFTFKKPSAKAIAETVIKVAKAEGFSVEPAAAELIALLADGSFRDSQSVLQKVLTASADKKVSLEEVVLLTGAPQSGTIEKIISGLANKEAAPALQAVHDAVSSNTDMAVLLMILIDRMRMLLMLRYAPEVGHEMIADLTDTDQAFLNEAAKNTTSKINSDTLRALIRARIETDRSPVPELPLELAIMELAG